MDIPNANMPIYTKKGDKGKTFLFNGKKVSKDSPIINALGSLDEVNSWLGIVGGFTEVQKDLMTLSSILAGAKLNFPLSKTKDLERKIDKLEKLLPKNTIFQWRLPSKSCPRKHSTWCSMAPGKRCTM